MSNEKQKPEMTLSDGNLKAALWKREGQNGSFYSASFSKTVRDDQGNYQNVHTFAGADLLKLSELSKQAYQQSRELQYRDRQKESEPKAHQNTNERER